MHQRVDVWLYEVLLSDAKKNQAGFVLQSTWLVVARSASDLLNFGKLSDCGEKGQLSRLQMC